MTLNDYETETIEVICISIRADERGTLLVRLEDDAGVQAEIDGSLLTDNDLPIPEPGNPTEVTIGVHERAFKEAHTVARSKIAGILHHHFDGILASAQAILDDLELYSVRIDPDKPSPAIGTLLEAWDSDPLLLMPDGSGRITHLGKGMDAASMSFTAWQPGRGFCRGIGLPDAEQRLEAFTGLGTGSNLLRGMIRLTDIAIGASTAPRMEASQYMDRYRHDNETLIIHNKKQTK